MIGTVDTLEDYEEVYLDTEETLELFAELLRTGAIWHLRYSVRRPADALISAGYLAPDGKLTAKGQALLLDEGREGSPCDANPELTEPEKAKEEPLTKSQGGGAQEDTAQEQRELWEASDDLRGGPFGIVPPEVVDEKA